MRMKSAKEKQGVARLFELAGQRKQKLILACTLSVLSSAARIVPFFTIYGVVRELLSHYQEPAMVDQNVLLMLCGVTFGAALVYGLCAFVDVYKRQASNFASSSWDSSDSTQAR